MATYVALLGDVNISDEQITMTALRELVEGLGYGNVQTIGNRGNVVFTTTMFPNGDLARNIHDAIHRDLDMHAEVIVRTDEDMRRVVNGNPFPNRTEALQVAFLAGTPDVEELADIGKQGGDNVLVAGDHVYFVSENGDSGTTFKPKTDIPYVVRDWQTVTQLNDIASGIVG